MTWCAEDLLELALAGDPKAAGEVGACVTAAGPIGASYMAGDHVGAWNALVALGPAVRREFLNEATAVAWETMRRVRQNLGVVTARLEVCGYLRAVPDRGSRVSEEDLALYEQQLGGPLPLSLRMFWRVVGSIDLTQAESQMVHDWLDVPSSDLQCLGDDDPLVVPDPSNFSFEDLDEYGGLEDDGDEPEVPGQHLVGLSPDRFHKAGVSGGNGYSLWVPDSCADFRIVGDVCAPEARPDGRPFDPRGQWFVQMLRDVQRGGGFRGPVDRKTDEMRPLPLRPLELELGKGLLPM
jgi:hypothetical protein